MQELTVYKISLHVFHFSFPSFSHSHLFVEFLDHVPKNRLKIQKIKCIEDLVTTALFSMHECREVLLPMMLVHLRDMMEAHDEISACIKVLSHLMDTLFSPKKPVSCGKKPCKLW